VIGIACRRAGLPRVGAARWRAGLRRIGAARWRAGLRRASPAVRIRLAGLVALAVPPPQTTRGRRARRLGSLPLPRRSTRLAASRGRANWGRVLLGASP